MKKFKVIPEMWDKINDKDIVGMYKAYQEWYSENEENMTPGQAKKMLMLQIQWFTYLQNRGLMKEE